MSNINQYNGDNYGGLLSIKYALKSAVTGVIDFTRAHTGAISIAQAIITAHFFDINFIPETGSHQEPDQLTAHGIAYAQSVSCRLVGDREEIRAQKRKVKNVGLVLLITDHNGNIKLVGTDEEPVRQTDDRRSGVRIPDTNGSNFLFTGDTTEPAPIVTIT